MGYILAVEALMFFFKASIKDFSISPIKVWCNRLRQTGKEYISEMSLSLLITCDLLYCIS